jgi:hypothetical protein
MIDSSDWHFTNVCAKDDDKGTLTKEPVKFTKIMIINRLYKW